ncbi:hypothetical protein [Pontibacter harenae]|uniref:hypothetical protein n=1 Tax=Pontibacter harenae TaxID=2894083 RepID=UPI001E57F41D|nr:hypothetical protein [Pontibacter harenae]MCC9166467.1 hypothetical protein [Pontibacter harenae]
MAQSVSFQLKASPNLAFVFDTFNKYQQGITQYNALQLNVEAVGTQWDLYVGTSTQTPGYWDVGQTYASLYGNPSPPSDLLQIRVTNINRTTQTGSAFVPVPDIANPLYLIGGSLNPDATTPCATPGTATNTEESYLTSPSCYKFDVDYKLLPGLGYRAGQYNLRVDFWIVADL